MERGDYLPYLLVIKGLIIPFIGTSLGAGCVLFMNKGFSLKLQKSLNGLASGVMVAAAIWSLIIPAIEQSENLGRLSAIPAIVGFCVGILLLLGIDRLTEKVELNAFEYKSSFRKTLMMVFAVVIHNIPEGMAVGVIYAGLLSGKTSICEASAFALSLGIAIQNFPEGAIISMPLRSLGVSKSKAFWSGVGSGIVEPIAGAITVILSSLVVPVLPYLLGFAAGAMVYVVIGDLVPEMSEGQHSGIATIMFMLGFSVMLFLDVTLG